MKKYFQIFFIFFVLSSQVNATTAKKVIETIGDVLQFLPVVPVSYALSIQDYQGLKEYAIGFGSTMGVVLVSKWGLNEISKKHPQYVSFAQRPNNGNFQGFPSGHTASAFSAVGFMQKRYGWKWGLPLSILAGFTGFSRVYAERHTLLQVAAGAMLGFGVNYLVSSKYIDPSIEKIAMYSTEGSKKDAEILMLSYSRKF
ncbi:hypothetical protein BBW65_06930 [Helicobacter enhydrae]|uniref:Phosphatidic acid phosphatase type 2/haloperoxidase domain-containing protein n=1 Tax=Helicobacter enhydrae TaxID=222136 RepID=A0A1B1U766_9HELI|nr:phosphatase PAP2 family protein [Helicobacter enhydrae]ANV98542.1 hypothetical protein BBW65_06930 [Helicobacter enhydrae]